MEKLVFNTIKNGKIFNDDFNHMEKDNVIEFRGGLAIVYAPNGTGKTSLTKLLDNRRENEGEIIFSYNGASSKKSLESINVIYDQNSRNIIEGEANDFILSSDIVKITELEKLINKKSYNFFDDIKNYLKSKYNIKTKSDFFIKNIGEFQGVIEKFVNSKYTFKTSDVTDLLKNSYELRSVDDLDDNILDYVLTDIHSKDKLLQKVLELDTTKIIKEKNLRLIGETSEAIRILNEYKYKKECLICDHEIDSEELLSTKEIKKVTLSNSLSEYAKKSIKEIIEKAELSTPLKVKEVLLNALDIGDSQSIIELQNVIKKYIINIQNSIHNYILNKFRELDISKYIEELNKLTTGNPKLSDEDIIYLKEIINSHIEKELKIEFDKKDNKKLKLTLDGEDLLNEERKYLKLSTGEQNFISLAFEFMRSKHLKEEIIVIDDPISSFDSIYKNKIIFCINNLAKYKKCLIFTHNIDLVKLIDAQIGGKYNLYAFQNKENSLNGFIKIENSERDILLKLNKLIDFFRADVFEEVENNEYFFISMIPFIRGYSNVNGNSIIYQDLSGVMHYDENNIENINLSDIYKEVFINSYININSESSNKSIKEIIDKIKNLSFNDTILCNSEKIINIINDGLENIKIFKENTNYKLLEKTLRHNLIYLSLRLNVERTLLELKPDLKKMGDLKLGALICRALKDNDTDRVFFMSRKTLVNDFNHFEGNMDIFQPAIDIKDCALNDECIKIMKKLSNINDKIKIKNIGIKNISVNSNKINN
ncbi:AAA family ATPase [Clostridium baratii]|uniref:AAA family ATPase n=1 Tax=Clostridium baratii TaxID=1561 RepID=UPI0030D28282